MIELSDVGSLITIILLFAAYVTTLFMLVRSRKGEL